MNTINRLLLFLALTLGGAAIAKDKKVKEGGIKVRLKKTVKRDYKDVLRDGWAYGPKQEYDKKTKQTRIWLPYGNNPALYSHLLGKFTDPSRENGMATFHSNDGSTNGILTYKIEFDRAICEFTFKSGKLEYGLCKDTVAGVEYSTNGRRWKTMREVEGQGDNDVQAVDAFITEFKASEIKTKKLYIRFYTRSKKEPEKHWGKGRWLQIWLAGDPKWGDIERTFFIHQPQLWVKKY